MNFATLCDLLDSVRTAKATSEKAKLIKVFVKTLRDNQHNLFCVLRLIVPKLDRDRPSYRIKQSKIAKLLVQMLGLPAGSDKNVLLKSISNTSVDFGDVIYSVLKKYIVSKEVGLTIQAINDFLDKIATRTNDFGLDDLVLDVFLKLSPKNIKWLIQIILKDLKLGISDNNILNCFHEDAADFYATNSSLKKICEVLSNPQIKLHELEINVFQPFRPMLSKRCDASNFRKCFSNIETFFIENKFDGERFQLHMSDKKFKYFSRNGFDYTETFGESFDKGIFTPHLKNVFGPETKKVILDGEMMLWNKNIRKFGSKGMNFDVKKLNVCGKYQPCFCVFDLLLHNDKVLTNQPLQNRLKALRSVIKNLIIGTIVVSEYEEAHSLGDIVNALNSSIDKNEEGIIVKDPKSVYKCSDRNSGWFKIKMDYFDDVVHDLDVLMIGGTYGANSKITSVYVGVKSTDTYLSFGEIGSGLTHEQIDLLTDIFKSHGTDFKSFSNKSEGKLLFGRDTPDVYIEPQHSYILKIRASELTRTTNDSVRCPYTLRFPRVLAIRNDKAVDECFTMNELLELTNQNEAVVKLNKRHLELEEITVKPKQAKRIKLEVVKTEVLEESGDFLNGKRFYVDSGTREWGINDIYHSIKRAGGEISYRLESNVDVVLVSKGNNKISELIKKSNHFDIIHVDWLQRVMEHRELVSYKRNEIFYKGTNISRDFAADLDRFGDSFVEDANKESLEAVSKIMQQTDEFLNINGAIEIPYDRSFRNYVAYFDCFEDVNNANSKLIYYSVPDEVEFEYYGGVVTKEITADVNLIVMEKYSDKRVLVINDFLNSKGLKDVDILTKEALYS